MWIIGHIGFLSKNKLKVRLKGLAQATVRTETHLGNMHLELSAAAECRPLGQAFLCKLQVVLAGLCTCLNLVGLELELQLEQPCFYCFHCLYQSRVKRQPSDTKAIRLYGCCFCAEKKQKKAKTWKREEIQYKRKVFCTWCLLYQFSFEYKRFFYPA